MFDQLSLSSWLPAALLVSVGAVLLEIHSQDRIDLAQAVIDLAAKPLGILVVLVFSLLVATMLLQAFELGAIRVLEGYWAPSASRLGVTGLCVRLQARRRRRLLARLTKQRVRAFRAARLRLLDLEVDVEIIKYHQRIAFGEDTGGPIAAETVAAAQQLEWRRFAPASLLRSYEALERCVDVYPEEHRMMPTRLGNTLRAGEDTIENLGNGSLRTFVIRYWHLLPSEIQVLHDQYRNRLDLYCTLVFVCIALAVGGAMLLETAEEGRSAAAVVLALFAACALASYRAAITSAVGYTGALQAIDAQVGRAATAPGVGGVSRTIV